MLKIKNIFMFGFLFGLTGMGCAHADIRGSNQIEPILSAEAPQPIGPYSQAIRVGGLIFLSGQVGLDPATGKLVGEDIESQTRQALKNLEAVLRTAGASFDQVVKVTVFLKSMGDFAKVNSIYGETFKTTKPARSTVEIARLPKDALIEIEMIAAP